jgi:hypothetical protein
VANRDALKRLQVVGGKSGGDLVSFQSENAQTDSRKGDRVSSNSTSSVTHGGDASGLESTRVMAGDSKPRGLLESVLREKHAGRKVAEFIEGFVAESPLADHRANNFWRMSRFPQRGDER